MKPKSDQFLKDILARYQHNELGEQEKAVIDKWFEDQQKAAAGQFPTDEQGAEQLRLELSNRLQLQVNTPKVYQLPYRWISIACSLLLIIGISIYYRHEILPGNTGNTAAEQVFQTPNGTMQKITLKDGTEIWMNAGTVLRVAANFSSAQERKVYLDKGEAFFKVKRDTLRPFSIATREMLTTVLGTSFNIRAYPDSKSYQVAVNTGKVEVTRQRGNQWKVLSTGLIKGEVLTYHTATGKTDIALRNAKLISSWKTDRGIYADQLTLSEIGAEIARQYAIDVKVTANGNFRQKYSLQLPHQDLQTVLQQLTVATGMNYQLNQSLLTINPATR